MDRETYLVFMLGFSVGLPWITFAIMRFVNGACVTGTTGSRRRDATRRFARWVLSLLRRASPWPCSSRRYTLLIVSAHATQPIRLDNGKLVTALVLFVDRHDRPRHRPRAAVPALKRLGSQSVGNRMAERKSFLLRIDPGLWAEIERLAQAELRSVNAQVEYLLRDALARRGRSRGIPAAAAEESYDGKRE